MALTGRHKAATNCSVFECYVFLCDWLTGTTVSGQCQLGRPGFAGVAMLLGVAMARLTGPGLGIAGMGLNMLLILTLQFYHPLLGGLGATHGR